MQNLTELIQKGKNTELAQRIQNDPEVASQITEHGISLLQFAAYCRNTEAIALLRSYRSELTIFEAASLGEADQVQYLLKQDPSQLNEHAADGFTPLGLASFFGHKNVVKLLLGQGADSNRAADNAFKVAPLHSACATSNTEVAELLLEHGAQVNAKQMQGVTPLHSAAHNGQTQLVQLLVQHGADTQAQTDNGQTPLMMALEKGFNETAALLEKKGS